MKPLQKALPGFACVLPGLALQLLIITAGLFAAAPVAAVTLAVCEEPATDGDAGFYLGQHKRVRLWQGEGDAPADSCVALELPLPGSAIRWLGLAGSAAQAAPDSLVLQGSFTTSVRVSEVQLAAEPPPPAALLPVEVDVLPQFSATVFGAEERVQATADGAWRCSAGSQPAGLVLGTSMQWEGAHSQELELQIEGDGALQLAVADTLREQAQAPLVLGTLPLQAEQGARVFRYRLPVQPQAWTSVTLLCPATTAEFTLQQLRVLPQALPAMRQRAAWFWAPALWQHDAERLFALAQAWNLQRLYISVPAVGNEVQDVAALQAFVTEAHARGIAVWPVLGDPRHVLDSEQAALAGLVAALQRYNQQAAADAKLDGLQLDIEPHLLPGFALAQAPWREAWLATVQAVQRQLQTELPLDLVVPVWWGTHPDWGPALLQGLAGPGLSLTVMNYRTDPAALRRGAQPFLVWGQQNAVPVAMALEAGSIGPDEQRLHFVRSAAGSAEERQRGEDGNAQQASGELLWLSLGDYRVLVLLQAPVSGLALPSYSLQGESRASATAITFAGDLLQLEAAAARVEPEWASWSSYSGLALHGLDEVLLQNTNAPSPTPPSEDD